MGKECFEEGAASVYRGWRLFAVSLCAALAALSILLNGCNFTGSKLPPDILATVNGSSITVEDFKAIRSQVEEEKPEDVLTLLINRRLVSELALKAGLVGDPMAYSKREEFTAEALPKYLERDVSSKITVTDEELNALRPVDSVVFKVDVLLCETQEKAQKALDEITRGGNFQEAGKKYSQLGTTAEREVRLDDKMFPAGVKAVLKRMKPGELSPVVKLDAGYIVFRLNGTKSANEDWEKGKEALREKLKEQKVKQEMDAILAKQMAESKVEINQNIFKGSGDQSWGARVDGITIGFNASLLKKDANEPHQPHQGFNKNTLLAALNKQVTAVLLTKEARKRGLDSSPDFQKLLKFKNEQILSDLYMERAVPGDEVTEQDIVGYYNKKKEEYSKITEIRVSRILLPTRPEAEMALKAVKAGKDFAAAAREYSTDESTRNAGGDIGFIDRGILKEPLKSTLSRMDKGEVSGVVQTGYGFEVLKLTDVRKATVPPLEEVREGIAKRVKLTKKSDKVKEFYTAMNKDAVVEINKAVLKTLK